MMRPIKELTKKDIKGIKLLVFDVDGVIVRRGTKIKEKKDTIKFKIKKVSPKAIKLIKRLNKKGYVININSGRGLYLLEEMFRKVLPYVSLTYENGSATWFKGKVYQHVNSFNSLKKVRTELEKVKSKEIKGFEPKEFTITVHSKRRVKAIERIVSKHKNLYAIWNSEAYDIGIKNTQTKSRGLKSFSKVLKAGRKNILAIGDNYNDADLLKYAGVKVSADKRRLPADFYIPLNGKKLPGVVLMEHLLSLQR